MPDHKKQEQKTCHIEPQNQVMPIKLLFTLLEG